MCDHLPIATEKTILLCVKKSRKILQGTLFLLFNAFGGCRCSWMLLVSSQPSTERNSVCEVARINQYFRNTKCVLYGTRLLPTDHNNTTYMLGAKLAKTIGRGLIPKGINSLTHRQRSLLRGWDEARPDSVGGVQLIRMPLRRLQTFDGV